MNGEKIREKRSEAYIEKYGKTFAEIPEIKKEISHRAKALKKLQAEIDRYL